MISEGKVVKSGDPFLPRRTRNVERENRLKAVADYLNGERSREGLLIVNINEDIGSGVINLDGLLEGLSLTQSLK